MSLEKKRQDRTNALERLLQVTSTKSAKAVTYTTALLGMAALIPGLQLPAALGVIATGIGVEAIGIILDRVTNSELSDDEIVNEVEKAIANSGIDNLLTKDEFYHAFVLLRRGQRTLIDQNQTIVEVIRKQETVNKAQEPEEHELRQYYPTAKSAHYTDLKKPPGIHESRRKRIFISFKRGVKPDESLAMYLYKALSKHHEVIVNELAASNMRDKQTRNLLEYCDFLICLLSEKAVQSELIEFEVGLAHQLSRRQNGKPIILPVRVAFSLPFPYPLSAYLNHLSWALWKSEKDTARLLADLLAAIAGKELSLKDDIEKAALLESPILSVWPKPQASANLIQLEKPDGTMDPESDFYIERLGDQVCYREIGRLGATIVIKAPRQMGKSSMLVRTAEKGRVAGKELAFLDFQLFDGQMLREPSIFFKSFCRWIVDELSLDDKVEETWEERYGHAWSCTKYIRTHILKTLSCPIVLAMDEVDRMLECEFRSDFFGMLRSWHNRRRAGNEWQRLDLILVISTEPYLLIDDLNQSPFNVGEVIRLEDFSLEQVKDLNKRHNSPFTTGQLAQLMDLLGGHPFLIRKAMYMVTCEQYKANELLISAFDENSPFRDHLRRHHQRFDKSQELSQAIKQVIRTQTCSNNVLLERLLAAGLVKRQDKKIVLRCNLYENYFQKHL